MNAWRLNRRVDSLDEMLADPIETEIRFDFNSFNEPERHLFTKVLEIVGKYEPAMPPQDVIKKNADLWDKSLEILFRRSTELFLDIMPGCLCCNEAEAAYFKLCFYNFLLGCMQSLLEIRAVPEERRGDVVSKRFASSLREWLSRIQRFHGGKADGEVR